MILALPWALLGLAAIPALAAIYFLRNHSPWGCDVVALANLCHNRVGTAGDVDAEFLRDVAKRGGGRVFFTDKPRELPRIFAQDTFVVARNSFLEQQTPVRATGGLAALTDAALVPLPDVGGYNLCYLRPGANLAAVTADEYTAPLVAAWQAGAGRVLCYSGEADGQFTGPGPGGPLAARGCVLYKPGSLGFRRRAAARILW
ncbi:MAG: hypothetical protein NTY65_01890 [Planctomycetota bacterium]|nr:hypothetical protein [Planctomycetota bacterium]